MVSAALAASRQAELGTPIPDGHENGCQGQNRAGDDK